MERVMEKYEKYNSSVIKPVLRAYPLPPTPRPATAYTYENHLIVRLTLNIYPNNSADD